jgi:hypothetical protein
VTNGGGAFATGSGIERLPIRPPATVFHVSYRGMNQPRSREKRRSPRVATSTGIWVSWKAGGPSSVSRVRDLSAGGVFISTDAPAASGANIKLLFALPEGELRIDSVVRYSDPKFGMGVEFKRMSAAARARLQELLRRLSR